MFDGLTFGWRTAILLVAVGQIVVIATALPRALANRVANRTLAALLLVLAGIVTPWMIGFAGFYDRWRWLTFAPFAITLAVAPLLYFYVHALVTGTWPRRSTRHLWPAATQALYLTLGFLLPMPLKQDWADSTYDAVGMVTSFGTVIGLAVYGIAGLRLLTRYRGLIVSQRSDDHRYAARWLSRAITATLVLLPIWAAYTIWDAISPLGYSGLMGLYVAIAGFALYLAIEGWRHAGLAFPPIDSLTEAPMPTATRDWHAEGERWAATVIAARWHAEPELSLAMLARRLGTNTAYLSRALNEGLGVNFSAFVNGLRCEAVAARLDAGDPTDLLDLALEEGFGSKASFNRAFQARYGTSPSTWRRRVSLSKNARAIGEIEARAKA